MQDKYLGMLALDEAQRAVRANVERLGQHPEYLDHQVLPVRPDASVDDLIPCCMTTEQPFPVVDDQGKLVGEVRRSAVAAAISRRDHEPAVPNS